MNLYTLSFAVSVIFIGAKLRGVTSQATNGDIRLTSEDQGRVEIYYDGQWGDVCHDEWDMRDATVVCRELGFSEAEATSYPQGTEFTWLDDVHCSGYENRLYECLHPRWGEINCLKGTFAGVSCSNGNATTPTWNVNGDVRLRGGDTALEGRVEVYYEESWHTVCDDQWDLNDARVVCRQLGYSGVRDAPRGASFGQGSGTVLLEDSLCYGYETTLLNCPNDGYYDTDCSHSRDAGVVCTNEDSSPYEGEARLVGSQYANRGRVEIYHSGQWGTVCDDRWDSGDADVICRQLGFGGVVTRYSGVAYGPGIGPIMLDIDCRGSEWKWGDCPYDDWGTTRCDHYDDAGVYCLPKAGANMEGKVRLIGKAPTDSTPPPPTAAYYGRVEIFHNDEWGRVCDDFWDWTEADVVCRQLGYPGAIAATLQSFYGTGTGPMMLDDVRCDGREHFLTQCGHDAWYWDNCGELEDAGARCEIPANYYPRLADGDKWYEGRVEVWNSGEGWERLCATNFYEEQASTICKQLGFQGYDYFRFDNRFGVGDAPPSDVGFYCDVEHWRLSSCDTFNIPEKDYCNTVVVRCDNAGQMSAGAICGIVFSVLFMVVCIVGCVAVMVKSKKNRNQQMPAEPTVYQQQPIVQQGPPAYSTAAGDVYYPAGPAYPPFQPTGEYEVIGAPIN